MSDSKLIQSLRYCKGITKNSMLSVIVPSYDHIDKATKYIDSLLALNVNCVRDKETVSLDSYDDDDDTEDMKYMEIVYKEAKTFLNGLKWQDEDKESIGIILYIGMIDDNTSGGTHLTAPGCRKVFHTFPIPRDKSLFSEVEIVNSERFNLDFLNRNPWFVESFGYIK